MDDRAIVGVAEAVKALREELIDAINTGANEWMRFQLDPIELEIQAVVTKDVDGKIGWKIIELGGKYETATTQTLKLKLTPLWRTPEGALTPNFTIAGDLPDDARFGPKKTDPNQAT